jgi:lipopolysaccharide heptosyltransferase I
LNTETLRARQFERILLIKPSAVGDVIHTVPVLVKLRARYPEARIDWLLTPAIAELIGRHPALSNVLLFPRQEWARPWHAVATIRGVARLVAAIRRPHYDLVVDLHGQFRSAFFAFLSGARVRIGFDWPRPEVRRSSRLLPEPAYRHGWTGAREGAWVAYTHRIPIPTLDVHAVDRYLWLGRLLGFDDAPPDGRLPVPTEAVAHVDALLAHHKLRTRPLAVLVPGTRWETKHWHVAGFAQVSNHLLQLGRAVVLAGSSGESQRCQAVADACPGAFNLAGQTTLSQLAALIQRAEVCVTNDSGSMHLTVALNRPVVSIFGPTDPVWIGPYGRPEAVLRAGLSCAPCYLRSIRSCPHNHACMNEVSAATVIERLDQILESSRRQSA